MRIASFDFAYGSLTSEKSITRLNLLLVSEVSQKHFVLASQCRLRGIYTLEQYLNCSEAKK